jgi:antitoxin PrlF
MRCLEITLGQADAEIGAFLRRLEADLQEGRKVRALPERLARAMLANRSRAEDFDSEIEGKVVL